MEKTGTKNLTFKEKTENFWYHYKWHTIVVVFFLIVAIMIVSSVISKEEPDVLLYYGGPAYFSESAIDSVEKAFQQVLTEDANNDGKKITQLIVTTVLSGDQVATKVMDAREEGDIIFMGDLGAANNEYNQEILYGQGTICLLDKAHYEESKERLERFDSLVSEDLLPEKLFSDGKGVYLKDTAFGKYFEVFDGLPDDTVLCIKIKPLHIEQEKYNAAVNLFAATLGFDLERPPEAETETN
ncbi:MAG: hypothetical protein E7616_00200 [Ruminococcaceae bacterium]|nr:hypothetical protein [Oscillospiraceae bacterium]